MILQRLRSVWFFYLGYYPFNLHYKSQQVLGFFLRWLDFKTCFLTILAETSGVK